MTAHAFTYGSLMWADIMGKVCGVAPDALAAQAATLRGHARHPVRGEDYPGVRASPDPAACVAGRLYRDVPDAAWARLDAFEGEAYERVQVQVETDDGVVSAWAYRVRDAFADRLLPGAWDVDAFEREGRARFLARYVGFTRV